MTSKFLIITLLAVLSASALNTVRAEGEYEPIERAMKYAHKAPKGEKKVSDRIIEGTASEEELKKTLELYKAMVDTKPPKGDAAAHKDKVLKLIAATEDVSAKKEGALSAYKSAVDCKACHSEHKGK